MANLPAVGNSRIKSTEIDWTKTIRKVSVQLGHKGWFTAMRFIDENDEVIK